MATHPISPTVEVKLDEEESEYLFALIHKGTARARTITRARVLSKLAQVNRPGFLRDSLV